MKYRTRSQKIKNCQKYDAELDQDYMFIGKPRHRIFVFTLAFGLLHPLTIRTSWIQLSKSR